MHRPRVRAFLRVLAASLAILFTKRARAQAWLPPQGEAWISAGYGNSFFSKHYTGVVDYAGTEDVGHIRSNTIGMAMGYGVTDRFELSVALPYIISKYWAPPPTPNTAHPFSDQDDGNYHGTFQDFRFGASYQVVNNGFVALSPFFTAVIPSHDYVYFAHAAPGKDLHQYLLGFALGGRLDRLVPGAYAQVVYDYAFVEKVLGFNLNRSDFGFEAGYFLTPSLSARFIGVGYYMHGGLEYHTPADLLSPDPPYVTDLFIHHDQIGKSSEVSLGGGLSYVLSGSTELYVSYIRSVYGRDAHKIDNGISFGVSWNFSPGQVVRRYFAKSSATSKAPTETP
ncbi:MAG TPA: hypothetical protein VGH97_00915 [Thermoanaerobaculia bacterium]|jgi:hypothetical protein